jgi:phosphoglycerol transferase
LTVDTHPAGGYLDEEAEIKYESQYKNVLADMSRQLYDFITWIQSQDFYENTTIVVLGDHLYMDSTIFPEEYRIHRLESGGEENGGPNPYRRSPVNIFINSLLGQEYVKNRDFSHFDMYPALIDSIGGTYNTAGLGLGRSLNKGEKTLIELFGIDWLEQNLRRRSELYNSFYRELPQ